MPCAKKYNTVSSFLLSPFPPTRSVRKITLKMYTSSLTGVYIMQWRKSDLASRKANNNKTSQALNITPSVQTKDLHNGHVEVWNPLQCSSLGAAYLFLRCYQLPRKYKDKSQLLYPVGMWMCSRLMQCARTNLCVDVNGSHAEDGIGNILL